MSSRWDDKSRLRHWNWLTLSVAHRAVQFDDWRSRWIKSSQSNLIRSTVRLQSTSSSWAGRRRTSSRKSARFVRLYDRQSSSAEGCRTGWRLMNRRAAAFNRVASVGFNDAQLPADRRVRRPSRLVDLNGSSVGGSPVVLPLMSSWQLTGIIARAALRNVLIIASVNITAHAWLVVGTVDCRWWLAIK